MQSISLGGRGNTASQRTHREIAPFIAAGKVPVPLGRECQQETVRCQCRHQQRSLWWSDGGAPVSFAAAQPCRERSNPGRQLNGAHSPHASLPDDHSLVITGHFSFLQSALRKAFALQPSMFIVKLSSCPLPELHRLHGISWKPWLS